MTRVKILQTENSRTLLTVFKDKEPKKFPQFLATTIATLSALSMGMCLSWTSSAIPMLQQKNSHLLITDDQGSWIGSLITLGACVGAIPAGTIANYLGRKRTLQLLSIPLFLPWILIAFSGCVYALFAARFVAGLAIGAISVAIPMYVAEIAHASIRGTLGTFFQVQITVGLLAEYILGGTVVDFKLLALISSVVPVVFLVTFSFMPETPVYLQAQGKVDEARKSLGFFRGGNCDVDDELTRIADDIAEASANKAGFSDLIDSKATFKGLIISLGLMIFQQLSGINAVLFYASNIFAETGSSMAPGACAILVGTVQVLATMMSTVLIDRAGRKILLFISALVMCLSLLTLGCYFHLKDYHDLSHLTVLPIVCLAVFVIVFSIGFGPIPWMMMGEIFPPNIKGLASSIAAALNWSLAFLVTKYFQTMATYLGQGVTFGIFGVICGLGAIFVIAIVPETKGKTVAEVREVLLGNQCKGCDGSCQKTTAV